MQNEKNLPLVTLTQSKSFMEELRKKQEATIAANKKRIKKKMFLFNEEEEEKYDHLEARRWQRSRRRAHTSRCPDLSFTPQLTHHDNTPAHSHRWHSHRTSVKPATKLASYSFAALLVIAYLAASPSQCQLEPVSAASGDLSGAAPSNPLASVQHQELLVQPNSQVRIECKLPQMSSSSHSSYYWNFQRSATSQPHVLCFESKCVNDAAFGIQLDMDRESGAYDLLINNVTYELNDGLYYCDYKDTTSETKQTINREFRLTVLIAPQAPNIVPAIQTPAREGQEYQLNCLTNGGNPEPNITWSRNDQQLAPGSLPGLRIEQTRTNGSTTSTLTWIASIDDHQAAYKCSVWNKAMSNLQAYEREFRLQVEYAPRISLGSYNPLKVLLGAPFSLPCSVDANPPVKGIRWLKDGQMISNQFNHTIAEAKISDSSVYSCQADNGIGPLIGPMVSPNSGHVLGPASSLYSLFSGLTGGSSSNEKSAPTTTVEAQLQVQVLYAPRVQVRAMKGQPLVEGDSLVLNCSADASPAPHEFIWHKHDDPTFKRLSTGASSYLEFSSLTANDMGNYTCTAYNRLEPSGYHHAIDKQSSASGLVQVRHKPGVAEISLGQGGETELGAKTLIQCRAKPPGFPEPQYKFWKFQGANMQRFSLNKHSGPVYTIYSAKADDEAKYGCMASNELGHSSDADGELIVNEAPSVVRDNTHRDEDVRSAGELATPYSITRRASGKPEPRVTWYHRSPVDGRRVELSSAEMMTKFRVETVSKAEPGHLRPKYNVVSTLYFKTPLEVDDRGRYTVEFSNSLSRSATDDFQLHINHAPIPAPRNQPVTASSALQAGQTLSGIQTQATKLKAGFDMGETVNLTCRVSAYPRPEFYWFQGSSESDKPIDTNSRYKTHLANPLDDIWESTLSFMQAQESDYGDYMCVTANRDPQKDRLSDSLQIIVTLTHKTQPEPPVQLEAIDATQDSVTLQWIPGFDGGFEQNQYLVQYAPDDGSGLSLTRRYPNADSPMPVMAASSLAAGYQGNSLVESMLAVSDQQQAAGGNYPRLYDCLSMNPCTIQHLLSRQAYVFRLRAKNERGFSEFSDELRASTRANVSQIPRILDASFDVNKNILHFLIESGPEYLLNNLNARIEVRSGAQGGQTNSLFDGQQQQQQQPAQSVADGQEAQVPQQVNNQADWRYQSTVVIRHERAEAYLNMQPDTEQIRITLCTRSNESLCGPEYVISAKNAASSFLQAERGLSFSILMSTLTLIVVLGAIATTIHSCCVSRKDKKADSIDRVEGNIDNKPIANNRSTNTGSTGANGIHKGSHGSTTSTNSTSVAANGSSGGAASTNGLQSMDSINGVLNGGSASDHSSDHSRQAKLDSMVPPNYNHYADRASIMMEQQQQQMLHQQGLMADKLASPFGMPNSALLSVANQQQSGHQQIPSPVINGSLNYFTYSQAQALDAQQQQSLEHQQAASMMAVGDASGPMMIGSGLVDQDGSAGQQQLWQTSNPLDGYNYNALGYATSQQQAQDQMIESAYGTTGLVSQQSATYDNSANNGQFQSYMSAYQQADSAQQYQQQRAQYQQEIAVAQQQMYGTLTRNGYSSANNSISNNNNNDLSNKSVNNTSNHQQLIEQQQYSTTNGLNPPPLIAPALNQSQESDYGTTGGRNGRLIREIIV